MGARRGGLTFTRFYVGEKLPRDLRQRFTKAVRAHVFEPLKPSDEANEAHGWCALERPFELELDAGTIFHDGFVLLGFRVDKWRVPSALLASQLAEAEQRLLSKTGRAKLGRKEKAELKQFVVRELRKKVTPVVRHFDVCWDLDRGVVLFFSHSPRLKEAFSAFFEKTFGYRLAEDSPYVAAQRAALPANLARALARVEPVRILTARAGAKAAANGARRAPDGDEGARGSGKAAREAAEPEGDLVDRIETTRFLGSDFLLWLWLRSEVVTGNLELPGLGEVDVWLDQQLVLVSPVEPGERVVVRGIAPSGSNEAREAVRSQKLPIRARVVVRGPDKEFSCTLVAPLFAVATGVLPVVLTKDSDDAFVERMDLVRLLTDSLDRLYGAFLRARLSPAWSEAWEPALGAWASGEPVPPALLRKLGGAEPGRRKGQASRDVA